jgi:hypothetical protein
MSIRMWRPADGGPAHAAALVPRAVMQHVPIRSGPGGTIVKDTRRTVGRTTASVRSAGTFTAEERTTMQGTAMKGTAMKERAQELKAAADEPAVVAKTAEMQEADRVMAERIYAVVKASPPGLAPKPWYGMSADEARIGELAKRAAG